MNYSQDAVARGLRFGTDDGELLTDERIQQRRFARVRPAENANESGVEGHQKWGGHAAQGAEKCPYEDMDFSP